MGNPGKAQTRDRRKDGKGVYATSTAQGARELTWGRPGIEKAVEKAVDWYLREGYVGGRPFGGHHA